MPAPSSGMVPSHHEADERLSGEDDALIRASVDGDQQHPRVTDIGSGIFAAPTLISQHVNSPADGLIVWVVAGLLVWTGAASFIELGLRIPSNGGIQDFGLDLKPAANAVIATIFADYLLKALWPFEPLSPWTIKIVALACVATLTLVNCLGATAGAKAANVFLLLKLSALASMIIIGFVVYVFGYGDGVPATEAGWFGWDRSPPAEVSTWAWLGNSATALFGALFSYGGWEAVGFVLGDMRDPTGDLPVVINGAMTIVISGFFLMNAALYGTCEVFSADTLMFFHATEIGVPNHFYSTYGEVPTSHISLVGQTNYLAFEMEFARRTVGGWGGLVFSVVVALSAMGALNANVTARDEAAYFRQTLPWMVRLPVQVFARATRDLRWEQSVPIFALLMNGTLASFYVAIGSFNGLVTFIGLSDYFFFMMSVSGILILRKADRHKPTGSAHTYKTWIGNPIIFSFVSGLLILRGVITEPLQGLAILFAGLLGLAVFYTRTGRRGFELPAGI
ncbi:Uu.00g089190.m01.CDS01 [Anthostomella pinea]|uniref:Uu.00g089190.m01.CDS01 n=1 Tax=Anthostomella pinea TaxID=933095 RepID=A0AAI8VH87_9PEZI|nr:Uu.00g089190.m01.CDS01 [Anthostomella pinea]